MSDFRHFHVSFAAGLMQPASGSRAIYRNTWLSGAVDALRENYPVTAQIVGSEMFEALAVDYASERPPRAPVLALYGRGLADWIEDQPWAAEIGYLSDVARVERLYLETLVAEDGLPATAEDLRGFASDDWNGLRLRLHPAVRFGWSTSPAMSIWLAHRYGVPADLDIEWRSQGGLFFRPSLAVGARLLDAPAHRFLFGLRLGETVGVSAIATVGLYPDADPGALLASLLEAGVFAALSSPERKIR